MTGLGLRQRKEKVRQRESWRGYISYVVRSLSRLEDNRFESQPGLSLTVFFDTEMDVKLGLAS